MTDGMYLLGSDVLSGTALTFMDPDVYEACATCATEGCDDCGHLGVVPHECDA